MTICPNRRTLDLVPKFHLTGISMGEFYMIAILNGTHETVTYKELQGIRLWHNRELEDYPLHWHTALEIIMPFENIYTVVIDGTPHTLHEGDIWITAPGTLHELKAPESGERLILLFDYGLICNVTGMDSLLQTIHPFLLVRRDSHGDLNSKLRFYLEEIIREYDYSQPYAEADIYSLMIRFFVTLGRANINPQEMFPGITSSKQHEYVDKFMNVCNYITEHCTENITVEELASLAGFSKFHFARLFKQFTNTSCYDYIIQKRIAYAEKLLIEPDLSITEVSMRSGFNSLSTFNRIFKSAKNCTPSEYKKLNRPSQR